MTFLATGFQQIDRSTDHSKLVHCLTAIHNNPFFRSVKEESFDLLEVKPGNTLLEIGCGTGEDIKRLVERVCPDGHVIGSDISHIILSEAQKWMNGESVSFLQMDGSFSAIRDKTCDAVREDRVLQHVRNPELVIREMYRVLKPEGMCVLFEPDWEAFLIDGVDDSLTRRILNFWSDQFAQGHIGRKLRRYCMNTGFSEVIVSPKTLILTSLGDAEAIFTITENAIQARKMGYITDAEASQYINSIRETDSKGEFFCSFTGFLVSGKRV